MAMPRCIGGQPGVTEMTDDMLCNAPTQTGRPCRNLRDCGVGGVALPCKVHQSAELKRKKAELDAMLKDLVTGDDFEQMFAARFTPQGERAFAAFNAKSRALYERGVITLTPPTGQE
jgi:hypothetical protein